MPELLHPGVYTFETSSGVRPIEGVSTSTAAFVGVADKGPIPGTILRNGRMAESVMVTSFTDYVRQFGGYRADSYLTYAVKAFFDNGGRRLYVIRVATPDAGPSQSATTGVQLSALTEGSWGDLLSVVIGNSSDGETDNNFRLVVLLNGAVVESFDPVTWNGSPTLTAGSPTPAADVRSAVNTRSEFIAITADVPNGRPPNTEDVTQVITVTGGPTGGTLALAIGGRTTGNIAHDAAASAVQTAVRALGGVASGATVIGAPGGPYTLVLAGASAPVVGDGRNLTGGSGPSVSVAAPEDNAVQVVRIVGAPTEGFFTLRIESHTTQDLARDAAESAVQAQVRLLGGVAANCRVKGPAGGPYVVVFGAASPP